jgi:hypothetical protein
MSHFQFEIRHRFGHKVSDYLDFFIVYLNYLKKNVMLDFISKTNLYDLQNYFENDVKPLSSRNRRGYIVMGMITPLPR